MKVKIKYKKLRKLSISDLNVLIEKNAEDIKNEYFSKKQIQIHRKIMWDCERELNHRMCKIWSGTYKIKYKTND